MSGKLLTQSALAKDSFNSNLTEMMGRQISKDVTDEAAFKLEDQAPVPDTPSL